MEIYFRDILLIIISRGANNCGQHSLQKNVYLITRFSPHFQLFYFNYSLECYEFVEWKIKRINNADLFSQPPLLIFIKGAIISGGHCIYISPFLVSNHQYICFTASMNPWFPGICFSTVALASVHLVIISLCKKFTTSLSALNTSTGDTKPTPFLR